MQIPVVHVLEGKCVVRPSADASIATTRKRLTGKCYAAVVRVSQTSRTQKENHTRMSLVKGGQDVLVIQMDSLVPVYVHAKNVETNMEYESLVV